MPKQKFKYFTLTVKVDEGKLQKIYNNASTTSDLIAVAMLDLEEDGVFLDAIKEVSEDTVLVDASGMCGLCKQKFKEGDSVTYLAELRLPDGSEVSEQEQADLLRKNLHQKCLYAYFNKHGIKQLYGGIKKYANV